MSGRGSLNETAETVAPTGPCVTFTVSLMAVNYRRYLAWVGSHSTRLADGGADRVPDAVSEASPGTPPTTTGGTAANIAAAGAGAEAAGQTGSGQDGGK